MDTHPGVVTMELFLTESLPDPDGDGEVNILDSIKIINLILGLDECRWGIIFRNVSVS